MHASFNNPQEFLEKLWWSSSYIILTNFFTHILIHYFSFKKKNWYIIWTVNTFYFVYRDDQILFNGALFYIGYMIFPQAQKAPLWSTNGVVMTIMLHAGPMEFLYYWFHRALHHHYLYSRCHSHHHSSIVTEPISCKILLLCSYICLFLQKQSWVTRQWNILVRLV